MRQLFTAAVIVLAGLTVPVQAPVRPAFADSSENLTYYFVHGPNGVITTRSYSGPVAITVSGIGQASGKQHQDGFYLLDDLYTGLPTTPYHQYGWELWINHNPASNWLNPIPPFNSSHVYTFRINAPGGPLTFSVDDYYTSDNSGSYNLIVSVAPISGRYVALGDSYSSGEGNPYSSSGGSPQFESGTDVSGGDQCHRSALAYPRFLPLDGTTPQAQFFACSGALVQDFTHPNHDPANAAEGPQLDHIAPIGQQAADVGLVTLGVGGDNLDFSGTIKRCYFSAATNFPSFTTQCARAENTAMQTKIDQLNTSGSPSSLADLYKQIRQRAPRARVLVLGYPHLFPSNPTSACVQFSVADQLWANTIVDELDKVIERNASIAGAEYIYGSYGAFDGHELCTDPNATDMIGPPSPSDPHPVNYSFHPNVAGQEKFAELVRARIQAGPPGQGLTISPQQTITSQTTVASSQAQVTFATSWPGSDVVMSLVSPTGRVIDRSTQAQDVTHDLGPTYEDYTITNPEPGRWTVNLYGASVSPAGEGVLLNVTALADTTPPIITLVVTGTQGNNGWYTSDVGINWIVLDPESRITSMSGCDSATINADTVATSFTCTASSTGGTSSQSVTIKRDATLPSCRVATTPNTLWPPNHEMVPVAATVTVGDATSGPDGFILTSVASNEGNVSNDVQGFAIGQPSTSGQMRAERLGTGNGRAYTLNYTAKDKAGNTSTCAGTVSVPHDQGQ